MRIVAIALAFFAAGCAEDTVLRIDIPDPGVSPAPASLRVTLVGVNAAPRTISPVTLPGTLVVTHVPAVSQLCVDVEGLDDAGNVIVGGAADVAVARHGTTRATVSLSTEDQTCESIAPPDDLAIGGTDDLGGGGGGGGGAPNDLARPPDLTAVQVCPPGATFCDDFELGNFSRWSSTQVKYADMGTVVPSMAHAAHGIYSAHATGSGVSGADNYIELEKDFPSGIAPPLALRANVWSAAPLGSYTMVIALYDNTTNGFSLGGDNNATWVLTENQTLGGAPDRHSTLATPGPGWHCVELVVDAGGNVSVYVDENQIIAPFARISAVAYTGFFFGIPRTVVAGTDVFIDDVAVGPSRLYCPP